MTKICFFWLSASSVTSIAYGFPYIKWCGDLHHTYSQVGCFPWMNDVELYGFSTLWIEHSGLDPLTLHIWQHHLPTSVHLLYSVISTMKTNCCACLHHFYEGCNPRQLLQAYKTKRKTFAIPSTAWFLDTHVRSMRSGRQKSQPIKHYSSKRKTWAPWRVARI